MDVVVVVRKMQTRLSALGHKRTCAVQKAMSALLPIATAKADFRTGSCLLTPESGHVRCNQRCLLWANSGLIQRSKKGSNGAELANAGCGGGVAKHRRAAWRDFLKQRQPFSADAEFKQGKAGSISTRPRQAGDEPGADGIDHTHKHDRLGLGCLLNYRNDNARIDDDHTASSMDETPCAETSKSEFPLS
jgi:hypothetical protein